jgi:hypothetical protein
MSLLENSDPFCLKDCLTYGELITCFGYHGLPKKPAIYLASKALVSLVNDAQWDLDRIRPSVFNFVDTDAVLFEGLIGMANLPCHDRTVSDSLAGVVRFEDLAGSLDFWDFQVSPTLAVYIDIILNIAPTHLNKRTPDDNDKMVIIEPVHDKYHVLVARIAAMINCQLTDPQGETRNTVAINS